VVIITHPKAKETRNGEMNFTICSQVLADPHPMAETVLVNSDDWPAAAVAVMNVVIPMLNFKPRLARRCMGGHDVCYTT
jgi:hypothetical protein